MQVFFGDSNTIPGSGHTVNRVGNLWATINPAYEENSVTYFRRALRWVEESYGNEFTVEELTNTNDPTDVIKRIKLLNSNDVQTYPVIWFRDAHYPVYSQPLPTSAIPIDNSTITVNADGKLVAAGGSAPSNIVTTDTTQTITGVKNVDAMLRMQRSNVSSAMNGLYGFRVITDNGYGALAIGAAADSYAGWQTNNYIVIKDSVDTEGNGICIYPTAATNKRDLGRPTNKWRDLYLDGSLTDGTNSVSIADLAALITYAKGQGWIQ